jgi:hypothetical protein
MLRSAAVMRAIVVVLGLTSFVGCAAPASSPASDDELGGKADGAGPGGVPRIDQITFRKALQKLRPDLADDTKKCAINIVAKRRYRSRILSGGETLGSIIQAEYTDAERQADAEWIDAQQQAERSYCVDSTSPQCAAMCSDPCGACDAGPVSPSAPESFRVGGYKLCQFVGYAAGPLGHIYDDDGLTWKVFFEFGHYVDSLTVDSYVEFSRELAEAGVWADSKIEMAAGLERFQFNDVIVHAHSAQDAIAAEAIGLRLFGSALSGYSRGQDQRVSPTVSYDWTQLLCNDGYQQLDAASLAFIQFQ